MKALAMRVPPAPSLHGRGDRNAWPSRALVAALGHNRAVRTIGSRRRDTAAGWSCRKQAGYLLHTRHVAVSLVTGLWQINCLHHRPRGPCCSPREAIDQERIGNKDGGIRPRNHAHKQGKSKVV